MGLTMLHFLGWELNFWRHNVERALSAVVTNPQSLSIGWLRRSPTVACRWRTHCKLTGRTKCCIAVDKQKLKTRCFTLKLSILNIQSSAVISLNSSSSFKDPVYSQLSILIIWEVVGVCMQMQLFKGFWSKYPFGTHGYVHWDLYCYLSKLTGVEEGLYLGEIGDVGKIISRFLVHWFFSYSTLLLKVSSYLSFLEHLVDVCWYVGKYWTQDQRWCSRAPFILDWFLASANGKMDLLTSLIEVTNKIFLQKSS